MTAGFVPPAAHAKCDRKLRNAKVRARLHVQAIWPFLPNASERSNWEGYVKTGGIYPATILLLCNGVAMARTAAERQAAYRKNRATAGDNGERRINVWVSTATALALQRLARRGEVTQRSVIEELVLAADEQAAAGLTEEEWAEYFSVTR